MQINLITYFCGICNAIYAVVCLLCGLQLCFGIFSQHRHANTYLSRILGSCLLVLSVTAVCYLLSDLLPEFGFLYRIGATIDICVFIGFVMMGYALYTNNEPSKTKLVALTIPFATCAILNICFPEWLSVLFYVAIAILFVHYIYFGVALQRREQLLGDIYSDPESHSLRWIWTIIGLFVGWWIVSGIFLFIPSLQPWYNAVVFGYMTVLFLFFFTKVSNYKEPVSLATQEALENHNDNDNHNESSKIEELRSKNENVVRLMELMEQERLYLNPDLTVEDVVKRLGIHSKVFSTLLHSELHISFAQFVNGYRVERAKELLRSTDDKVEFIGTNCGFNSRQSFYRVFVKATGKTPAEWREG